MSAGAGLLDAAFVRELEALRRRLDVQARSGASGERTAKRRGGSAEFQEHRPYSPGDDLRRVDWMAYARTGEPVVKLFRAEEDVVLRIVVDSSRSMEHGQPSKLDVARRLAAAIGYMALASSERAQVVSAAEGLVSVAQPARGRAGLPALLRDLDRVEADGRTNLARAIDSLVARTTRPGLLVVLSDFFDGGPVTQALGHARAAGHDVALLQVLAPDEIEPTFEGDWTLEDAETGAAVDVTMDASAIEAYVLRLAGLVEELRGAAKRLGATYVRVRTDDPLEPAVRRFVARGVD